jgi:glycerophosphoryl diester phosphodiesterase
MTLPAAFFARPIAHRGLWGPGAPENSLAAARAAVAAGYGIECDLQPSADGQAMVFHDEHLFRLTGAAGPVAARSAAELGRLRLLGGDEGVPTLGALLALVAGRVPLLVEIKDQSGRLGPSDGRLEAAVAAALARYHGPVAVMSFNPHAVAALRDLLPGVPRGLVTDGFDPADWPGVPPASCERLRAIPDFDTVGASFVSHGWTDLGRPRLAELRARGAAVLCWTVRSPQEEARARRGGANNVTFEGYLA